MMEIDKLPHGVVVGDDDTTNAIVPDSTTISSTAADLKELSMTVTSSENEEAFSEFFLNEQTILSDVSSYLTSSDDMLNNKVDGDTLKSSMVTSQEGKDLLASAILSIEDHGDEDNNVSSTIRGFPDDEPMQLDRPESAQTRQDVYTLTLTDGSVVHLKVQPPTSSSSTANADLPAPLSAGALSPTSSYSSSSSSSPPPMAEEIIVTSPIDRCYLVTSPPSESSFDDGDDSDEAFMAMLSSHDEDKGHPSSLTLDELKAQLTNGQTADLGALLRAAKIDLSVDDIVNPPLTQVKRVMEQKGLDDWQVQLCIKIRRRKKNTAAVRSSRRKRSAYVSRLRHEVAELSQRRKDAQEENQLLKQLHSLWERLCSEVEAEIHEGVKKQLGMAAESSGSSLQDNPFQLMKDLQDQQQQDQQVLTSRVLRSTMKVA